MGLIVAQLRTIEGAVTAPQKLQKSIPSLKRGQFTPGTKAVGLAARRKYMLHSDIDFDDGVAPWRIGLTWNHEKEKAHQRSSVLWLVM